MKITENFKRHLRAAKADGYENIYVTVGVYKATTYCVFHKIDKLLADPIGYNYGCGHPWNYAGMWTGHPNTRMVNPKTDIMYTSVFCV